MRGNIYFDTLSWWGQFDINRSNMEIYHYN